MAVGDWSSELAAEFGLPDGWYVDRQLKLKGGKEKYVTTFRNGLSGKVLKSASQVEGVLGYKPQFPKPCNKSEWYLLKRGRANIGVDQNMLAKREMDEMAREFTLLVKTPGQGQGFAGKGSRTFTVPTTLGANLREAVADAYQKNQGKRLERGFRLKGPKQVTSGYCITVKDFVAKCGALDGDFMECCMDFFYGSRRLRQRSLTECLFEVQKKPRSGSRLEKSPSNRT